MKSNVKVTDNTIQISSDTHGLLINSADDKGVKEGAPPPWIIKIMKNS